MTSQLAVNAARAALLQGIVKQATAAAAVPPAVLPAAGHDTTGLWNWLRDTAKARPRTAKALALGGLATGLGTAGYVGSRLLRPAQPAQPAPAVTPSARARVYQGMLSRAGTGIKSLLQRFHNRYGGTA